MYQRECSFCFTLLPYFCQILDNFMILFEIDIITLLFYSEHLLILLSIPSSILETKRKLQIGYQSTFYQIIRGHFSNIISTA